MLLSVTDGLWMTVLLLQACLASSDEVQEDCTLLVQDTAPACAVVPLIFLLVLLHGAALLLLLSDKSLSKLCGGCSQVKGEWL